MESVQQFLELSSDCNASLERLGQPEMSLPSFRDKQPSDLTVATPSAASFTVMMLATGALLGSWSVCSENGSGERSPGTRT